MLLHSGNLFEKELKRDEADFVGELRKVREDHCQTITSGLSVTVGVMYMLPCALLMERGHYSDAIYRAEVNHRDLDTFVMKNRHSKGGPVLESFCAPGKGEEFDNVILLPHSVRYLEEDAAPLNNLRMVSQGPYRLPKKISDKAGLKGGIRGSIKGMEVCGISNADFQRLLKFFGYKWVNVDEKGEKTDVTEDPSIQDMVQLMHKLRGLQATSPEAFQGFLRDHKFDPIFKYREGKDVVTNLYLFGRLLRSLVPVRFSPCEGQHRMWCFSSMIQGLPDPTDQLPLQKKYFAQYEDAQQLSFPTWQIHKTKQCTFVSGKNSEVNERVISLCHEYSDDVSKKQVMYIDWNYHSHVVQVSSSVGANFESWDLKEVNASNHWCHYNPDDSSTKTGCIALNASRIWERISFEIDESATLRMQANLTGGQHAWPQRRDAMLGFANKKASGFQTKPPSKANRKLHVLFSLMKALATDKKSFYLLADLARAEFEPQRHPNVQEWVKDFRTFEFLARLLDVACISGHFLDVRLWTEMKLCNLVRKNERLWQPEIEKGIEIKFPQVDLKGQASADHWHSLPANKKKISRQDVPVRSSHIIAKVGEALHCVIVQSMLRWLGKHGYDFVIFEDLDETELPEPAEFFGIALEGEEKNGKAPG